VGRKQNGRLEFPAHLSQESKDCSAMDPNLCMGFLCGGVHSVPEQSSQFFSFLSNFYF